MYSLKFREQGFFSMGKSGHHSLKFVYFLVHLFIYLRSFTGFLCMQKWQKFGVVEG